MRPVVANPEPSLIRAVARQAQEVLLDAGETWPMSPWHGRHPLVIPNDPAGQRAKWTCPVQSDRQVGIGPLPATHRPTTVVPDNTVRWWLEDIGVGVIAHSHGDILVTCFDLEDGPLREGGQVAYQLAPGSPASHWRRASQVRPIHVSP